ncbi:uncharacterized protein LOC106780743, partial [Vigna radiata var. radiata]|uniref:Uncharacterized protein LOC106780743 n=1 Tax=Vigna radiata var. radiata TaxID=3916 RepID=A0A1S3W1G8_VIGRR
MVYILAVNPYVLGEAGMPKAALFTATTLASIFGTISMAFIANVPIAQAPGMGLNAFFAFSVVNTMGYSWQFALTAVFIEGLIFIILTVFNIRESIINSVPKTLKNAIPAGIGLFIAFIGLRNAKIIVPHEQTLVTLGKLSDLEIWITLFGLILVGILTALNVKGAILISVIAATLLGIPLHITHIPKESLISLPPSITPIFAQFEWTQFFTTDMLVVVFTFLFVNLFDTVGTLWGVASKASLIKPDGSFPKMRKALFADAIGTTVGAILGVSP